MEVCDYLIIGGGVAGCIIARRLAERTAGRIILVEAGRSDEGDPAACDLSRLDEQTAAYEWGFRAAPLPGAGAELDYSRARILGGCANHNDCAFLIPPDSDFDRWAAEGAAGWGAAAVRPYFQRIEERVHVERRPPRNPVSEAFVAAGRELGLEEVAFRDEIRAGVGWFPLNARGAVRQSTSAAYLHPLAGLPRHLEVWTETFVERVGIEAGVATGALTSRGPIQARREVILTAGAIQTPQLLLLSGIGPGAELRALGIGVVADCPGVGRHLLDHVAAAVVWDLDRPVPAWALTPFEAVLLLQVDADAPAPDALFHFGLRVREKYGADPRLGGAVHGVKASPNVARARSQGSLRLASADPRAAPVIALDYFSDPDGYDLRILLAALKFARRIGGTRAMQALGAREVAPGPGAVRDADLIGHIRRTCETVYHPCGTARMGAAGDRGTVVTPDLRVLGVGRLRVCDASVFPSMVTVNIANTVMMVAEKAADAILAG